MNLIGVTPVVEVWHVIGMILTLLTKPDATLLTIKLRGAYSVDLWKQLVQLIDVLGHTLIILVFLLTLRTQQSDSHALL